MKVLFVCLGNICRSPMAEAILSAMLREKNIDGQAASAGTAAYHLGKNADPRTLAVLRAKGILFRHSARQITISDLHEYDYILTMDKENFKQVKMLQSSQDVPAQIIPLRHYDPLAAGDELDVPDPYYGTVGDFEKVYAMLYRSIDRFLHTTKKV